MPARASLRAAQPGGTDLIAVPAVASDVVLRQCGVITRAQLRGLGFTASQVRAAVAARRWQVFGRRVVVLSNAPLSLAQQEWVAVLLPAKTAALAGASAATAAGLRGFAPDTVHIVVRHAVHTPLPPWVELHESRRFTGHDVQRSAAPPRTRIARSVVDAATWSQRPRRACAFLCAAVQQRLAKPEQLQAELAAAGHIRHAAIMRTVLGDISGGGHTLAEIDLGPLARRAGLQPPRRQCLRPEPNGKVRYVDAEFDLPDGTALVVEVDGAVHLQPESWWSDTERQNELVIGRRPVLRFPSLTIRLNPETVVDQLRRMRLAHTR